MSFRLGVTADLIIRKLEEGDYQVTVSQLKAISGSAGQANEGMKEYGKSTEIGWYQTRRLTYDLRAMSIGLMILKRELGGMNPILDAGIQGLYLMSGAASTLMGVTGLLAHSWDILKPTLDKAGGATKFLSADIFALGKTATAGTIAVGGLIALAVGATLFEWITGVTAVRTEITRLEREVELLTRSMRSIKVEQASLNAVQAEYTFWEQKITLESERRGYATLAEATSLKYLAEASKDAQLASLRLAMETARSNATLEETKDRAESAQEGIDDYYASIMRRLPEMIVPYLKLGQLVGTVPHGIPGVQIGGEVMRTGVIEAHKGEIYMQREQAAGMVQVAGGYSFSVSVSLPGARISNVGELNAAFRNAGEVAGEAVTRRLELLRRRSRSRY